MAEKEMATIYIFGKKYEVSVICMCRIHGIEANELFLNSELEAKSATASATCL